MEISKIKKILINNFYPIGLFSFFIIYYLVWIKYNFLRSCPKNEHFSLLNQALMSSYSSLGEGPKKKTTKVWTYVRTGSTLPT